MMNRLLRKIHLWRVGRALRTGNLIEIDPKGRLVVPRTRLKGRTVLGRDPNGEY